MDDFLIKQYEILIGLVQRLSERRQHTTQIYLAVNAAILALSSFVASQLGFKTTIQILLLIAIFVIGLVICEIWHRMLRQYREIARWRYDFLIQLESKLEGSAKFFTEERKEMESLKLKSFSDLEIWLPRMFKILYLLIILFLLTELL